MKTQKIRRQIRTRNNIKAESARPRLSVFRSSKYISAQLIDDKNGKTIIGMTEKSLVKAEGTKTEKAKALGLLLADKIKAKKITQIVFDRGSYAYHGRVESLAKGLREGGLDF